MFTWCVVVPFHESVPRYALGALQVCVLIWLDRSRVVRYVFLWADLLPGSQLARGGCGFVTAGRRPRSSWTGASLRRRRSCLPRPPLAPQFKFNPSAHPACTRAQTDGDASRRLRFPRWDSSRSTDINVRRVAERYDSKNATSSSS